VAAAARAVGTFDRNRVGADTGGGPTAPAAEIRFSQQLCEGISLRDHMRLDAAAHSVSAGGEALELGDVARFELFERGDAEQFHGAHDLFAEDRDRPFDPGAAARHEPV
jgi:hypothetical protein